MCATEGQRSILIWRHEPRSMKYSVIIPLFNRPEEIDELLDSLTRQTIRDFEVLVIEDGSSEKAESIVTGYADRLNVHYHYKENGRQGFARNYGFERASGDWMIVFDSDCIIPPQYFEEVEAFLANHPEIDVFGGPDAASPDFSPWQKAISYAMTSPLTTGGIRGGKNTVGTFHPRSFNMGISRRAWEVSQGYRISVKGEDIEFSLRLMEHGMKSALIPGAFVFHKRRTSFKQFSSQVEFFGRARINIQKFYPSELKLLHWLPVGFYVYTRLAVLGFAALLLLSQTAWAWACIAPIALWKVGMWLHAFAVTQNFRIATLAVLAGFVQLSGYGKGLLNEYLVVNVFKRRDSTIGEIRDVPLP